MCSTEFGRMDIDFLSMDKKSPRLSQNRCRWIRSHANFERKPPDPGWPPLRQSVPFIEGNPTMKSFAKAACATISIVAGLFSSVEAQTGPNSRFAWDGSRYIVGTDRGLLSSTDARTWSRLGQWSDSDNIAALASNGRITIALGEDRILRRISGDTITNVFSDHFYRNPLYEYAFWTGSEFIMVGANDTLLHSKDGTAWTSSQCRFNARSTSKVAIGDSGMVFVLGSGADIASSKDGYDWNYTTLRAQPRDVIWNRDRFILVGDEGMVAWSKNGRVWQEDSVIKEAFHCQTGVSCPTVSDGSTTTELTDSYNSVYGIARLGTTIYLLDVLGIRTLGDFGIGPYLREFKSDFWPWPWGEAGSRIFSLADGLIWSTGDGTDSLVGVIDTTFAPRSTGIGPMNARNANFRLDASGIHAKLLESQSVVIDLVGPQGSVRRLAQGRYATGSHNWSLPREQGLSYLRIRTDKGTEVLPIGIHR